MDIPSRLLFDLRDILHSKPGGLYLDEVCGVFQRQTKKELNIRRLGFPSLEAFIRAIPSIARLQYSAADKCMKVFGTKPMNFQGRKEVGGNYTNNRLEQMDHNGHGAGILGPPYCHTFERPGQSSMGLNSKAESLNGHSPHLLGYTPDSRGIFFLSFPAENRPDLVGHGSLKNLFGLAGTVSEINETSRWIYVGYTEPQAVARALKMFSHLGMTVRKPTTIEESLMKNYYQPTTIQESSRKNFYHAEPRQEGSSDTSQEVKRTVKYRTPAEKAKRFKDRKKKLNNSIKVYVGNLDPAVKYTFDMFRNVFRGYRLEWVTLKTSNNEDDPRLFAFILISTLEKATELCKKYNGYVWMGRTIQVNIKEKKPKNTNGQENSATACDWSDAATNSSLPELMEPDDEDLFDMPGLEPLMPGLEPDMPGLEPGMPGLEPLMPGLEPGMPGLEPLMPELEPGMPGLEPLIPGLEPSRPGLEPLIPGLESGMPGLEPCRPGLEPSMPRLEPGMPGLEPLLPGLESDMPGLEPLPPRSQFSSGMSDVSSRRGPDSSCNTPTVLVANLRDGTTEAEVLDLFAAYGAKSVNLVTTIYGRQKAFVRLGSIGDVKRAVDEVNQTPYRGWKILVDVPFNMPALREAVLGQVQPSIEGGVTLSEILKMRGACLQILQSPDFPMNLGQQIKVLITTVISDKFFWGQIVDNQSFDQLRRVSEYLNQPDHRLEPATGPGRCSAIFQGDRKWYRAWLMHAGLKSDLVRVFYLDYGNTAAIPWSHTNKLLPRWVWDLQPVAIPFALTEPVTNLKSREMTHMLVEINALGGLDDGNMVVVRAISLVPNLLESVSGIGQTVVL